MTRQGLDGSCSQMRFLKLKRHAWVTFSPVLSRKNPAHASPLTPSYSKSHATPNLLYYCQVMAIKTASLKQHYLMNFLINIFFSFSKSGCNTVFLCNTFWEIFPLQYFAKHGIQIRTYFRKFQRQCSIRCFWTPSEVFWLFSMLTSSVYFIFKGWSTVSGNTCFPQT